MDGMINIKLNHQEGQYYRPWDKTWRNSGCIFFPEISIFPYTPWISSLLDFFCTFIFKIGLGLLHTKKALGNYGKYWKLNFPTTLQKTIFIPRTTGNPGYTPNTMMLRYCTLFRVWWTIYIKNSTNWQINPLNWHVEYRYVENLSVLVYLRVVHQRISNLV